MKCPECTGEMEFNSNIRRYVCQACGAAYRGDEIEDYWEDKRFKQDEEDKRKKRHEEYKEWYFSKKK